jgi:putative salt-induced outer membrane protein YdiY
MILESQMRNIRQIHPTIVAVLTIFASVFLAGLAEADDSEAGWQPPPPMPDEFDWVQMTSGEWLKGEIIAMYEDSMEFDSDEFDMQTLDWADIREIRSAQIVQVAFEDDVIAIGKLLLEGDTVRVMGERDYESTRTLVLSIAAGAPKERNYWSGKFGAGLNLRSGNTEQTEYNANVSFKRRTPKNRILIDYLGNFSESDGTTIADNQSASAAWNRFVSRRFYISPVYAGFYRDPFQNIARRWTVGTGVGYQIVDTSKVEWSADVGIAYQRTDFDDVSEADDSSATTPAFAAGTRYDNELTGWMDYFFDYTFFIVNEESGTYTHRLNTGFEFEFFGDFDFDVSIVWDRIQDPRENSDGTIPEQDDFRTIFGVSYSF